VLNLGDQIRTRVYIVPPRLLVHDVINYGVPVCAFYGNVKHRRSKHKPYPEYSGTFASSLVSLMLIKLDLTNSPAPAQAVQGRPKVSASKSSRINLEVPRIRDADVPQNSWQRLGGNCGGLIELFITWRINYLIVITLSTGRPTPSHYVPSDRHLQHFIGMRIYAKSFVHNEKDLNHGFDF
jgi:hypothetical protein